MSKIYSDVPPYILIIFIIFPISLAKFLLIFISFKASNLRIFYSITCLFFVLFSWRLLLTLLFFISFYLLTLLFLYNFLQWNLSSLF